MCFFLFSEHMFDYIVISIEFDLAKLYVHRFHCIFLQTITTPFFFLNFEKT